MSDTDMEISKESYREKHQNTHEMEEPSTSECLEHEENQEKMVDFGPSEVAAEETLVNDSETIDEILRTDSALDSLTVETPVNKPKQNTRLPLARIKQIMKFDADCNLISRDSLVLISKATEMFIEFLGKEAVRHTLSNKKKTITKKDVEAAIDCAPNLYFLDGALEWD